MNIAEILKLFNKVNGEIFYYKRSKLHPLIGKRLFNDSYSFFFVEKVWNIKGRSVGCSGFNYNKDDDREYWEWKVQIRNTKGVYILPLHHILKESTDDKGKLIPDQKMYYFYK